MTLLSKETKMQGSLLNEYSSFSSGKARYPIPLLGTGFMPAR